MTWIIDLAAFLAGFLIVAGTIFSAIETFVLPRSVQDGLTRFVFITTRIAIGFPLKWARSFRSRDRIMAFYGPLSLLALAPAWYLLAALGFTIMYWGLGVRPWQEAYLLSGSSLLTLGFDAPKGLLVASLAFSEAVLGLLLVALLIAYLPIIYAAFQRRESAVTLLAARAGTPPSVLEMLPRYQRIHGLARLADLWPVWESWFADVDESHTSLPALVFFRSPSSEYSWVTSAGAVLDTASLVLAAVDIPANPQAMLCIRSGFLALQHIAASFNLPYPSDPHFPQDPISISQAEFESVLNSLSEQGVPIKTDRDQAWKDFSGWRVNYDQALLGLCSLTMAPPALWSSDRAGELHLSPVKLFGKRLHTQTVDKISSLRE